MGRRARGEPARPRSTHARPQLRPARRRRSTRASTGATCAAEVQGTRGRIYRHRHRGRKLADSEWEQVADAIAAEAAHAAALLDGELDPALVAGCRRASTSGCFPGPGDLRPDCSCPDWAEPCKHAAALCYLVADELDRDPFQLFLLRGMDREHADGQGSGASPVGVGGSGPTGRRRIEARQAWARSAGGADLAPVPEPRSSPWALPASPTSPPTGTTRPPRRPGGGSVASSRRWPTTPRPGPGRCSPTGRSRDCDPTREQTSPVGPE